MNQKDKLKTKTFHHNSKIELLSLADIYQKKMINYRLNWQEEHNVVSN